MTKEEIIGGLQFTVDMFLFDPNTGENREEYELNDMDKTTIEACKGAIELLEQEPKADVLDKIRNEMADLAARTMNDNRASGIWTCVDILDKYKRK